ncbi:MAG TPA: antibiotic biosynthesis monooxygenase family protein [Pseudonocardiaceae bacterium]|jgi:heme-degrading monooxygenase HmoA
MMVFINRFEVHAPTAEFELLFRNTSEFLRHQPGFRRFRLVRSIEHPNRYVNIAEWDSAEALRQATAQPEFRAHADALRAVATTSPDMHEPVYEVTAPDAR